MQNTLSDFKAKSIQQKAFKQRGDQKVIKLLSRFSSEMLKDTLRNNGGHTLPEWGEGETWRFYYLDECKRRGKKVLEQLGWPAKENSLYVNLYTGCIGTLIDIATHNGYTADRYTINNHVWSIIEHWEPYDESKQNLFKIEYLNEKIKRLKSRIENKEDGPTQIKMDKRNLKEAEEQLEKRIKN